MLEIPASVSTIPKTNPTISDRVITIGMVAGEASGDILGSGLIKSLRKRYPNARFEGIGGPLMIDQGFKTLVPMERLSVMGLFEVLGRLFELIGIRRRIKNHFLNSRPDIFIGVDAPDFNIGLELALRKKGIKTGHYVSPSVWAWRQKRVFKIARAVDLMLTLFPFEAKFYKDHHIAVSFVGHPLADSIPIEISKESAQDTNLNTISNSSKVTVEGLDDITLSKEEARRHFGLTPSQKVVALLPGSRTGEIFYICQSFIETARWLYQKNAGISFLLPYVNLARKLQIEAIIEEFGADLPIKLVEGQSRKVMVASDVIVLASGTATLEAMLLKRPMVVAYRVSKFTHFLMKRLLKAPFISLPNLLAGKELVPELIQDQVRPELIGQDVLERLDEQNAGKTKESFTALHYQLKQDASERAADAVSKLLEKN